MKFSKASGILLIATVAGVAGVLTPALGAAAAEEGCGYGAGGPHADTICWIDMSSYDEQAATSPAGQQLSLDVGGYLVSATIRHVEGADGTKSLQATPTPTYSGAVFGNDAYLNVPGAVALYQLQNGVQGDTGSVELSDISVTAPSGASVTSGFSFIMADAESTNNNEIISFTSDSPVEILSLIEPAGKLPACGGGLTGAGSTTVVCTGDPDDISENGPSTPAGAILTSAESPTRVSIGLNNGTDSSRQGIAFGVMFANAEVSKIVASRYLPGDQFVVTAQAGATVLASAATSGADTDVSTGSATLLASTAGSTATFSEAAASGGSSDLSHYDATWSCTRNGATIPLGQLTVAADGKAVSTAITVGDSVVCAVTNTARFGTLSWAKTDTVGGSLAGSGWSLDGPSGIIAVQDNGTADADPAVGSLRVGGLLWGDYALVETVAPSGYVLDSAVRTVTISGAGLNADLGAFVNVVSPRPPVTSAPSESLATPGRLAATGGSDSIFPLAVLGGLAAFVGSALVARRRTRTARVG
ncbi:MULTISPECIES: SpaA isopeptide-forming pilin-related protein [unclassified Microbacterium]|uniref:SpaA isopeptide-forming pilin-related protein n=1 Tax=unclassified Microbacterium TaxID=2609290 RepID=UPI0011B00E56|nr:MULTISPECIES: SpaA isopeptide-forming pilin-related protein [unclassified Microbacterium]